MSKYSATKKRPVIQRLWQSPLADLAQILLVISLLVWIAFRGSQGVSYTWQWYRIPPFLCTLDAGNVAPGPLLQGLAVTLRISAISLVLSLAIGLITAFFRLANSPLAGLLARVYIEIVRNTPLLIQIFFIYFVLGPVLGLDRLPAAILSLSLFEGAYIAEIFRSGILAVPREQVEAAYSLGLGPIACYRHVILPQAIRTVLPPLTNQTISLIKDSALVSTIAIYDITMQAQAIIAETFLTFEVWLTVAALYLGVTTFLSFAAGRLELRLRLP
jgi:polar amino acid transport system permease protein